MWDNIQQQKAKPDKHEMNKTQIQNNKNETTKAAYIRTNIKQKLAKQNKK